MKVVHVAPVWLPVSEGSYGGIETLLAQLVAAQRELGHEVTLVAAGDSQVSVPVVAAVEESVVALMERGEAGEYGYYEQELLGAAMRAAAGADVVHSHAIPGAFVLDDVLAGGPPVLHTLHGQVTQDLLWSLRQHPRAVVAVSGAQHDIALQAGVRLQGVVHNGLDMRTVPATASAGEDLLFLGRMEPQKGPDLAITAARATGRHLVLAGPVTDREFYAAEVVPLLGADAEHVGVLGRAEKFAHLGRSACLLVPSRWSEPFGMVSLEAMACGTPVVATARGALPEVVEDGITGRIVHAESDLPGAVTEAAALDRTAIRARAWERFHIELVAARYLAMYTALLTGSRGAG